MLIMQVALIPLLEFVTTYDIHNYIWQWKTKIFKPRIPPRIQAHQHKRLGLAILPQNRSMMSTICHV